ncbi:hypothetical protein EZJ49_10665 [Bdellovibrio bacteriovorus]|uniref:hypothetical protein n=1 Tax=Bdellovibrio bacteriovorus TaxID=959 RepID=UPI0021D3121E|nr:hypothetical protein [Bdellovibrio bacteriovorus]UXR63537.1 hypothetical protein EZJ49_10665 [Bdellovibrio bacteriovorus]
MAEPAELDRERAFLHEVGVSLNGALFIIDRLIEEIKEEEGRLETDSEIERLFNNLASALVKIDYQIKARHTLLSELLNEQIQKEKRKRSLGNSSSPVS